MSRSIRRLRSGLPVLVSDVQTMGALAVVRSLGRGGYPVHASSPDPEAIGFRSRWATRRVTSPSYTDPGFGAWLDKYLKEYGIHAIVPSDSFLLAIRSRYSDYASLLPCSRHDGVIYLGQSKARVFDALTAPGSSVADHLPRSIHLRLDAKHPPRTGLEALGAPLFLKVDALHARQHAPSRVVRADSAAEALAQIALLQEDYEEALIQGYVPGRGVGACFLRWNGAVLAEFQHRRIHEVPHTGGVSSLRESFVHEAIREDAAAKLAHLGWQGVAMLEYRLDEATGQYAFLELNGRFWGSLHLALYAGVDFPAILMDAFHGLPRPDRPQYRAGVRCRNTIPGGAAICVESTQGQKTERLGTRLVCAGVRVTELEPANSRGPALPRRSGGRMVGDRQAAATDRGGSGSPRDAPAMMPNRRAWQRRHERICPQVIWRC